MSDGRSERPVSRVRCAALIVALAVVGFAAPRDVLAIPIVACPAVIAAPGTYELVGNLNCPAGDAVTVTADFVNINLAGFTINGQGTGSTGIYVTAGADGFALLGSGTIGGFETGIHVGASSIQPGIGCGIPLVPITYTNDVRIDAVTVRASRVNGVELCYVDGNSQVVNSRVIGSGGDGIQIRGTAQVSFTQVRDAVFGIRLEPLGTNFDQVFVLATAVRDVQATAVVIAASGQSTNAEIRDGWIRGAARGIVVSGDVTTVISGMQISETRLEAIHSHGSTLGGGYPIFIENSIVRSVGEVSPVFAGAIVIGNQLGGGHITSTTVRDITGGPGIWLACATSAFLIEDSVVRNAAGDGLLVSEGAAPLACTNQNGAPNANVFRGNLFKENGGSGMAITAGLDHQLIDNVVSENGLDGILIGAAATGVLTDNRAQRNVDDGFQLDTAALTLTGNVARANGGYGFETTFVGPVLLDGGNTATNNTAGNCNDPGDLPSTSC
jgi:parallel beta-helix repeat protein